MNPPRNSVTADRCRIASSRTCVAPGGEHRSANHTIPHARRSAPQAERGAVLPEDWQEMSLGALWDHLDRDASLAHGMDDRLDGRLAALKEPANIERLQCDDDTRIEINERISRPIAVESLTRWLTLLSENERVWLRGIAARLRRAA